MITKRTERIQRTVVSSNPSESLPKRPYRTVRDNQRTLWAIAKMLSSMQMECLSQMDKYTLDPQVKSILRVQRAGMHHAESILRVLPAL